jgi:hypothetical protein
VISKPDSPTILDSKAEALYQIGLIEEIKKKQFSVELLRPCLV